MGLSGKLQSGKSTASNAIANRFGFVKLSFAAALKRELVEMGYDEEALFVTKPAWARKLMQEHGHKRRAENPDYWLNKVKHQVSLCKPNTVFIIDDVRFLNEAMWVEQNGVLIRIERPGYDNPDQDPSEVALDEWPFAHVVYGEEDGPECLELIEHVTDCLWYEGRK